LIHLKYQSVNLYFQDETRLGLFTRNGKTLTARGVKPICPFQQVFKSLFLFGAFSPINGDKFLYEMPECNSKTFQAYLNQFSQYKPNEYKIIVLDNGAFHKASTLVIPDNIKLVFLPPYSPELNPAEKMWAIIKRKFTGMFFKTLDEISVFLTQTIKKLTDKKIKKTCAYEYIFSSLIWTA
jgi:transposase